MKEVVTGLSNSTYVEITEGLSEGETVYYTASGEESSFNFDRKNFGNMGNGESGMPDFENMPNMDNMPSGGSMPGGSRQDSKRTQGSAGGNE